MVMSDESQIHMDFGFGNRTGYCDRIENARASLFRTSTLLVYLFILIDLFLQITMMTLPIVYLVEEKFINEETKNAFISFYIFYMLLTIFPSLLGAICMNIFNTRHWRCGLVFFSTLQMGHLYLLLNPYSSYSHQAKESMKVGVIFRSIAQVCIQITFITILAVN